MDVDLIRKYASRMAEIFAFRAANARRRGETEDYVRELESRTHLWSKISQLPPDSDKWEFVKDYIVLMSTPKTTKMELRRQYKRLQELIAPDVKRNPTDARGVKVKSFDLGVTAG